MSIEMRELAQPPDRAPELEQVRTIAVALRDHLSSPVIRQEIARANRPGASSQEIQTAFRSYALEVGFVDESKGLFSSYERSALRPDYFMKLGATGILLEVERGKTTINNMDLLDFWKCHLCEHAHYLFLVVPRELRQNEGMSPRREFQTVTRRLAAFFTPRNYTNVRGLFVFGY